MSHPTTPSSVGISLVPLPDWNEGAERLYGYSAGEAIGKAFCALVWPDLAPDARVAVRSLNAIRKRETTHIRKDGTPIQVSVTQSPIHDAAGQVVGASIIARDITERMRAAAALRESEDQLRLILDSVAEGIFGVDLEGHCTFCNHACLRLLGYDSDSMLLGKDVHRLIHHSRVDGTPRPLEECRVIDVLRTGRESTSRTTSCGEATERVFGRMVVVSSATGIDRGGRSRRFQRCHTAQGGRGQGCCAR